MLAGTLQNLQQIGKAAGAFAADNQNRIFSFSQGPGPLTCGDYVFPNAPDYVSGGANQAVCILRERAGRHDITAISGWIPHLSYSPLVLLDYLGGRLPLEAAVSPGDAPRLAWKRSVDAVPGDPGAGYFTLPCRPAGAGAIATRWQYSSSYELQPSMFTPDAIMMMPGGSQVPTLAQDPGSHRTFQSGSAATVFGNRRFDEIAFPSNKAMMYETAQRFFGSREAFFMYDEARIPVLFPDGTASIRSIRASNPGFQPNIPATPSPTRVAYSPETSWEPATLSGAATEFVNGHIRWTRSGLRGRDFLGPEIPWTP